MPSYKHINANLVLESERGNDIVFEGSTTSITTTLTRTDPTANRTITFPDASGTVALTSDISSGVTIPIEFTGTTYNTYLDFDEPTANNETIWLPANRSGRLAIADGDSNLTDRMAFYSTTDGAPELDLVQYNTSATGGPRLTLDRQLPNTSRNGKEIGRIDFQSMRSGNVTDIYGSIIGRIAVDNNPGPGGWIEFEVSDMDANASTKMMTVFGGTTASQFDQGVRIDNGQLWLAPSTSSRNGKIVFEQLSGFDTILQASTSGTAIAGVYNTLPREGGLILTTNNFNYENVAGMSTLPSGLTIQRDEDGALGAQLTFYKNSTTPADNDYLAIIDFEGENSAGQQQEFASIRARARDVTDGTEDGYLMFTSYVGGSFKTMASIGSTADGEGVVINSGDLILRDQTAGAILFEGTTSDNADTTLTVIDPTADRTISLPDKSGTVALISDLGSTYSVLSTVTIDNPTAETSAHFGQSVDISGKYMIVGAPNAEDTNNTNAGKAYIFDKETGYLVHTLNNPNADTTAGDDRFGTSVAISGNYAVVGAYLEDDSGGNSSGKAYIFDVTTGNLLHTLDNPNAYSSSASDYFSGDGANGVAVHGKYSVIGAYLEDDSSANSSGKAYVYNNETGALVYTFDNPNTNTGNAADQFGYSVDISDHYVVVGARYEDTDALTNTGAVYVFDLSDGSLVHTIPNPNPSNSNEYFGASVAIDGNYILIGAWGYDYTGASNAGIAYVYDTQTGTLLHTLENPTPGATDYFGLNLDISGNYAVIGARADGFSDGNTEGRAYVFDVSDGNGTLVATLENPNPVTTDSDDRFGHSAAISGNYIIVGAYYEDASSGETDDGKAYVFNTSGNPYTYSPDEIHSFVKKKIKVHTQITIDNPNAYSTAANDGFGTSISISGDYGIASAAGEDDANFSGSPSGSGKAYIFDAHTGKILHTIDNPFSSGDTSGDSFGAAVDISGNYAIVTARYQDDAYTDSGAAYIYDVTTGKLLHTLDNPNAYGNGTVDYFGYSRRSAGISGNYAIVGAWGEDELNASASGKAYIFNVATGSLVHTLDNPNDYDTAAGDRFGDNVAISGNYAVITAEQEDDADGTTSGTAYIFDVISGTLLHTLNNPNPYSTSTGDQFGYDIGISGNYVIAGAPFEDSAAANAEGKAYIFDVISGTLLHTLNNPNAYGTSANDNFGVSVSISGNYAIVSATGEDEDGGTGSGKVYIFDVITGNLVYTLDNPNAYNTVTSDGFGWIISISGNKIAVGVPNEDESGSTSSGKAYLFHINTDPYVYSGDEVTSFGSIRYDQGIPIFPSFTANERTAISNPVAGMVIYNTTFSAIEFYNGTSWRRVSHTSV